MFYKEQMDNIIIAVSKDKTSLSFSQKLKSYCNDQEEFDQIARYLLTQREKELSKIE